MNYDAWAEWYDVIYSTDRLGEVEFYVDLARRSGGPVLEIGVGTGRIAIPTAQASVDMVGIDLNEPMLGRARVKLAEAGELSGSLELIRADMRDFDLGKQFPLVTIPARALLLATTSQEQQRALACAANHLAPGGSLVFNTFVPDPVMLSDSSRDRFFWGEAVNPANGRRCLLRAVNRFDTVAQTNDGLQIVEELDERGEIARKVCLEVKIRYLYASEIHEMLVASGLGAQAVYGSFDRTPFHEDSKEMIFVCRRGHYSSAPAPSPAMP